MLSYNGRFSKAITFFDTANVYGDNHDNEIMVGKALKQLPREKIQLATKFGVAMSKEAQLLSRIPLSMEIGIGIVAYGPLGHGFFGGKAVMESLHNESMLVFDYK
nr:putative aldo-keto reductase 1 [Quercus suber]